MTGNIDVQGMVISSMPIGEYDRRLEILTGDLGKISAFARGARKPASALVSVSRPFAFGQFSLYQGKNSYSLSGAKISNYFEDITKDIVTTYYGFYFLELCSYFCREANPAKEELRLLYQSLRALLSDKFDNRLVRCIFELKLISLSGYAPSSDHLKKYARISKTAEYTYNFVVNSPVDRLYTFRLEEKYLEEFEKICLQLVSGCTDKEFNSLNLLETVL